ncbi:P-loop containing nucleoside triphosphate hydrolase protein, partial [Pavlovales sp. CCMP2436]
REYLNCVCIGHVYAGKSTFSGQIMLATGQVDERMLQKFEQEAKEKNRESWFLAYIMDTDEEERAKGKTVQVGRAHFETAAKRYTILDAPGHKNYVPNMIAGACQADVGVLVISARKGEFETGFERGGQTREHALLAKTLGVRLLVVAINKMDDPTVDWSKERYDDIIEKLAPFLKSCGYNMKKDVIYMPMSALKGVNVTVDSLSLDDLEVPTAFGGENVKVKLREVTEDDIKPGFVLSDINNPAPVVRKFEAQVIVVELLEHKSIFSAGYTAVLHCHAIAEECAIVELTSEIDKKTGKRSKKKPMFVKSGGVVTCIIEVEQNICVETFDVCPQLGRFTLRDEGKTIGIGKILRLATLKDDETSKKSAD